MTHHKLIINISLIIYIYIYIYIYMYNILIDKYLFIVHI